MQERLRISYAEYQLAAKRMAAYLEQFENENDGKGVSETDLAQWWVLRDVAYCFLVKEIQ